MGLMECDADEQLREVDELSEIPLGRRRQGGRAKFGVGQLSGLAGALAQGEVRRGDARQGWMTRLKAEE